MPTIIEDVLSTRLFDADDKDHAMKKCVLNTLVIVLTVAFGFFTYGNYGKGENYFTTPVSLTLSLTQIISVVYVNWLVIFNRRQSDKFHILIETPIDIQMQPCFLHLIWHHQNDKHMIRVILIWTFGFVFLALVLQYLIFLDVSCRWQVMTDL